ncbi:ABC transporter substrate-binding protein [Pseudomonas sp. TH10]|uniref:ABC transporter substrate-binding protein n=1 Tax=Pseudomonas sp. TH10 TaxID=2796376 RepID=UPI0019140D22|nr:ABC transporter substrate-binding protein [Pseudomonas sp. TH10]MBK5518182.1 ABC transporter substrate-binding protein [Pseudomonas sp. TH10]
MMRKVDLLGGKTRLAFGFLLVSGSAILLPDASALASTLRLGIAADALTLDPIHTNDNPALWTELLIYDQLVRTGKDGKSMEPGLAEKWEISADGKDYTFHLRRNAKFSNGEAVTAEDVVFSLKRAAGETSDWGRFFRPITRYNIIDQHTVKLSLDKPFTPMLSNLAMWSASILPRKAVEAQGDAFFDKPVGSGPFQVGEWRRGEKMQLNKNPGYWNPQKPEVDSAVINIVADDNARALRLQAGELDAIVGVPFNQIDQLKRDPNLTVGLADVLRTELVQLNTQVKPFDDVRVRQALNYAIDKNGLIKGVLRGNGSVATSPLPVMAYNNTDISAYPYDPEKAKALLAEAGLTGGFKAKMLVASGDATPPGGECDSKFAEKIGVEVELQLIEISSQFSTTKSGNYEMALSFTTSDTIDPDQLVGFTSVNPERADAMHTRWKDARVNELYELERSTPDGDERGKQFKEIEAQVHAGAPFIFLYHQKAPYAARKNVEGFEVLPTSNYRLEDVSVK